MRVLYLVKAQASPWSFQVLVAGQMVVLGAPGLHGARPDALEESKVNAFPEPRDGSLGCPVALEPRGSPGAVPPGGGSQGALGPHGVPVVPEPGVKPDVGLPRGEDSFKCDICGNFFKSDNGLRIHKGKRHKHQEPPVEEMRGSNIANSKIVSPLKDVVREEEPNLQVFICDKCGEEFDVEDNLVTHMEETHRVGDCVWCHHCKQLFYDSFNYIVNSSTIACPGCSAPWPHRQALLASLMA